jgi:hypothetical protein
MLLYWSLRDNLLRGGSVDNMIRNHYFFFSIFFVSNFNLFDILKFVWVLFPRGQLLIKKKLGAFTVFLAPCDIFEFSFI